MNSVELTPLARRQLEKLSRDAQVVLAEAIDGLCSEPRPEAAVELRGLGDAENHFRLRVADYRIVYQVRDRELIVLVISFGARREIDVKSRSAGELLKRLFEEH